MPTTIRRAVEADQAAITALVRLERLNPADLDWRRFWVAACGPELVGAVQVRRHPDGSREVGSLVVARSHRHQGIASRLLEMLLTDTLSDYYLITGRALAGYYSQRGFQKVAVVGAPRCIRRNYLIGQLGVFVISCIKQRKPQRLIIMHRPSVSTSCIPERSMGILLCDRRAVTHQ